MTDNSTSFGFRDVAPDAKQGMVNEVFHSVAERYDLMNDLMSAGLHRLWKDAMVSRLAPPRKGPRPWKTVDVAGGTGDIAFRLVERADRNIHVTVADINTSMLGVGRARAEKQGYAQEVDFVEANAEALPFADQAFDAYTIAFGIRNVPRIDLALSEAYRVLKPGGRLLCLEFSAVQAPLLDKLYDAYSFKVIPPMGKLISGDADSYQYLVESIRKFPNQARFAAMIEAAGFKRVEVSNFTGGIAALHTGVKL